MAREGPIAAAGNGTRRARGLFRIPHSAFRTPRETMTSQQVELLAIAAHRDDVELTCGGPRGVGGGGGGRGGRGGRRAPAVQSPLRPRLPRRSGEAVVRRGHLRYLRHQDGGHSLLRIAVRRCQGGGGDPSHGTGPLRADPHPVGALRLADSLGLRRAVLLPRDPRGRRRAPAWRAIPLASRFPCMPKRLVYLV